MKLTRLPYLLIILLLAIMTTLPILGRHNVNEWDEARNGENAYEMYHNKDFVNLYYDNKPDTWNAKPPLMIWMIVGAYHVFGFNEFALRIPSFLATLLFFIYAYQLVKFLGKSKEKALLVCTILLSCNAILGLHMGLTGDFDSLLIAFLTASAYYFVRYLHNKEGKAIYLATLFTGLGFYTKGTAAFVLFPGFILYALISKQLIKMLKDKNLWLAALVLIAIVGSWIFIIYKYGITTTSSFYGSKNSIETLFIYDTISRITGSNFGNTVPPDYFFFFSAIDARLNIWNYLFYLALLLGMYSLYTNRKTISLLVRENDNRLALFSICLILPLSIVLTVAIHKHDWYLAPIFLFIVCIMVEGIMHIRKLWAPFIYMVYALVAFCFARHAVYGFTLSQEKHEVFSASNKHLKGKKEIVVYQQVKQDFMLYLKWLRKDYVEVNNASDLDRFPNLPIVIAESCINEEMKEKINLVQKFDGYCLAIVK